MKKNDDKLEIKKPKSMILDEIAELEEKKKNSNTLEALKISIKIQELSLQLKDQ